MAPLVLTMGEPAGIGGEIALTAWLRRAAGIPVFALIDDPARLEALARHMGKDVPIRVIKEPGEAPDIWASALPVLVEELAVAARPGHLEPANAPAVIRSIERAVRHVQSGAASGIVTNPIHKQALLAAGFNHPGHTEFLAELAGDGARSVMMLACPGLRVVPVTVHVALSTAIRQLTTEAILATTRITAAALRRDFAIPRPRLAIAGLNPHAGEGGAFGREEIEIIQPAIDRLRAEGIAVEGPVPPDTMFHLAARARYDAAICMYHDQALIPLKTIDFERGVNITLGLPFVRTSPDHGTALDIAGTGAASAESLIAALTLADHMAKARTGPSR